MMFSSKQSNPFMRTVTGYTSADTSSNDGVERSVTNARFTDQTAKFEVGNKYTFSLERQMKVIQQPATVQNRSFLITPLHLYRKMEQL